jgi:hypothetical protein
MLPNNTNLAPHSLLPLPEEDDTLIRRSDLPLYIPVARQTWARWASEGTGPPYINVVAAWSLIVLETSENGSRAKPEATPSKQHKKKPAPGQGAGKALIQRKYYTQLVLCLQVSRDLQCHNLGNEL